MKIYLILNDCPESGASEVLIPVGGVSTMNCTQYSASGVGVGVRGWWRSRDVGIWNLWVVRSSTYGI